MNYLHGVDDMLMNKLLSYGYKHESIQKWLHKRMSCDYGVQTTYFCNKLQ